MHRSLASRCFGNTRIFSGTVAIIALCGSIPVDSDLDLPILAPVFCPPGQHPAPPVPVPCWSVIPNLSCVPTPEDDATPAEDPPPIIYGESVGIGHASLIYVLDISGSMVLDPQPFIDETGARVPIGTRLERAQAEVARSVLSLPSYFRFTIIVYDCGIVPWTRELQRATPSTKADAIEWVRRWYPQGGTGTGPAVAFALDMDPSNQSVVLLTDGDPNCGPSVESHRFMIRDHNIQDAAIDVFGIQPSDGAMRLFCQHVAQDNAGRFFEVP